MSVRHDEEKYLRCANALKAAIEHHFDGQLGVEIVGVTHWYAMEVRVMPIEYLPNIVEVKLVTPFALVRRRTLPPHF